MCGIAIHAALQCIDQVRSDVEGSLSKLDHRGPDGSNIELVGRSVALGHTRLAIVGNNGASQPLNLVKGNVNYHIVHNGEIYNYKALMEALVEGGDCSREDFKTEGDSEVLLACLAHRGIDWTIRNIRGMFAFVFVKSWVAERGEASNEIIMCRDTFGIKPLCYGFDEVQLNLFACSELQAMPHWVKCPKDVLPSSFVKISVVVENGNRKWSICESTYETLRMMKTTPDSHNHHPLDGQLAAIREKLVEAVAMRIPEGIRMAVLLSGGVDSSIICRIAADLVYPETLYAFTVTTHGEDDGDSSFARVVAKETSNIVHEEVPFSFEKGIKILPNVVRCMESIDVALMRTGVPLYFLSKHIAAKGFKVVLCGEGADEPLAGYRLFEEYMDSVDEFHQEVWRRTVNIDSSELQRVDRCTSAHGLEARVPFLDVDYVAEVMRLDDNEKMTHPSLGRIQKHVLRKAFDGKHYQSKITGKQLLPDSVLYREKEQFADGMGRCWISKLQEHAMELSPGLTSNAAEVALYKQYQQAVHPELQTLIQSRSDRRRKHSHDKKVGKPGRSQPRRWFPVRSDPDLAKLNLSKDDVKYFMHTVLGWSLEDTMSFAPTLDGLNKLIVSILARVPFHNLTLLTRERRPPTMSEIKNDMMSGIGGPCSVVNSFFAVLLDRAGYGPHVYLLSCEINQRTDCHVAILLQFKGLRYFVDVANAKPYDRAVHLGDKSTFESLDGSFQWGLRYNRESNLMEVHHSNEKAISFDPARTVPYSSFREMIEQSRSDTSFGPFLTGLRFCIYPDSAARMLAVRDACIYNGTSTRRKHCATGKGDIRSIARQTPLSLIDGFDDLVNDAISILNREWPVWFEASKEALHENGIAPLPV